MVLLIFSVLFSSSCLGSTLWSVDSNTSKSKEQKERAMLLTHLKPRTYLKTKSVVGQVEESATPTF